MKNLTQHFTLYRIECTAPWENTDLRHWCCCMSKRMYFWRLCTNYPRQMLLIYLLSYCSKLKYYTFSFIGNPCVRNRVLKLKNEKFVVLQLISSTNYKKSIVERFSFSRANVAQIIHKYYWLWLAADKPHVHLKFKLWY